MINLTFFKPDQNLENIANNILNSIWDRFPSLSQEEIALTWLVYDRPVIVNTGGALSSEEFWQHQIRGFSYRGDELIYPASIVKLFYLVAIYEWLESEMLSTSPELERAIQDMIIDSSNDATSLVVDTLTGTTSGPELPPGPMKTWTYQRNLINRYFKSLGWPELEKINVNQKTWGDGPYGREKAFVGEFLENRNMLTTNAVARLLHSIIGGVAVSSSASQKMMNLLKRNIEIVSNGEENQIAGFLGETLPENTQIWSKAGWTSKVRHDAAYIEIPDQSPYLLVVFTEGEINSQNRQIIPAISQAFAHEQSISNN